MKKILISAVCAVLAITMSHAQNVKFGVRGGLNLPNITAGGTATPISEGYKSRLAVGAGIFTEVQFTPLLSFRLGVEYSGMGGKKNGMQALPMQRFVTEIGNNMGMTASEQQIAALAGLAANMPQFYYVNTGNTVKFDYVMIPLLAQFDWNLGQSPWRVYLNAGPFVSFLISGKQVADGASKMYTDQTGTYTLWDVMPEEAKAQVSALFPTMEAAMSNPVDMGTTNITGEMKSANFGLTGNVGVRYQCGRNYFFMEAGGNYGFIPVQSDDTNGNNRLGAASVMAGYAFSIF
jgi:hypothetical protein